MKYYTIYTSSPLIIIGLMISTHLQAKPFIPDSDSQVLMTLPLNNLTNESYQITQLKQQLRNSPNNSGAAYKLSNLYMAIAREQSDPRYYGLAEAVIKPWWHKKNMINLMIIKAQILAFNHNFIEALAVLNDLEKNQLQMNHQTQAELIVLQSSLYQIIGDYAHSRQKCGQLVLKTSPLISAACFFSVNALSSESPRTKQLIHQLHALLDDSRNTPLDIRLWILSLLAETASLSNNWPLAESFLVTGLQHKADHTYLLSLYADLLLKQNRLNECIVLLEPHIKQTAILVRLLAAESRLSGHSPIRSEQSDLELQIKEDEIKQDQRHYREYGYYQLYVQKDYQSALHLALINWKNQKELSDSLLLYRVAHQLQQKDVLKMLDDWVVKNTIQVNFSHESLSL